MTKEELKIYISEAVDALDTGDLELLFPPNNQPDLYTIVEELSGLKGALNKLSGSNLKLNHEIHNLAEQVSVQQEKSLLSLKEEEKTNAPDDEVKSLLLNLLEMDELIQLTTIRLKELPKLNKQNKKKFKLRFASWQNGFGITIDRWRKLLQSNSLYKIGLPGETFDPELHEAVAVKHLDNLANNIILETEQTGFLYKGQVIRLAKVVVNKKQKINEIGTIPLDQSETVDSTVLPEVEETTEDIQNPKGEKDNKEKTKKKKKKKKKKKAKKK